MPNNIACLPNEILLEIFKLVPLNNYSRIGQVCRRWKELLETDSLYRTVVISETPEENVPLEFFQQRANILITCIVTRQNAVEKMLVDGVTECVNLQCLVLNNCRNNHPYRKCITVTSLTAILEQCPKLRNLEITDSDIEIPFTEFFHVASSKTFTTFVFLRNTFCNEYRVLSIDPEFAYTLPSQQPQPSDYLVKSSDYLTSLELTIVAGMFDRPTTVLLLLRTIIRCNNLRKLSLLFRYREQSITDDEFTSLKNLRYLTNLTITYLTGVSSNGFRHFFAASLSVGNLKTLNLYKCENVDSSVIDTIVDRCSDLIEFQVNIDNRHNVVTTVDNSISRLVENCSTQLRSICLFDTIIPLHTLLSIFAKSLPPKLNQIKYSYDRSAMMNEGNYYYHDFMKNILIDVLENHRENLRDFVLSYDYWYITATAVNNDF